jgi:hypothetical protein
MPATRKPKSPTPKAAPRKRAKAGALPSPFDPKAAREALGRETKAITRLQKDAARNAWQIGRRLTQVVQLELHGAGGFDSIEAYAEQALGIARTTTFQYMRVSQAFSEEVVATFGLEKLDRALAYIAKTPEVEAPTDIPQLAIRVPSASGGVVEKPFAQVTIPELRRAAQREADRPARRSAPRRQRRSPRRPRGSRRPTARWTRRWARPTPIAPASACGTTAAICWWTCAACRWCTRARRWLRCRRSCAERPRRCRPPRRRRWGGVRARGWDARTSLRSPTTRRLLRGARPR